MIIEPQSKIYLVNTPLLNDYKHTLSFNNLAAQTSYFTNLSRKSFTDYTYIRENSQIVVAGNIDSLRKYNYLYYTNNGSSSKTYYCFITKMEWLSDNSTRLTIETDVLQTFYFDIIYKKSFVEREHVSNDTIGLHTIPESLELGEYTCTKNCETVLNAPSDFYVCFGVTEPPTNELVSYNTFYNGLFSGLRYIAFKTSHNAREMIDVYEKNAKHDAINSIFMIPSNMSSVVNGLKTTWGGVSVIVLEMSNESDNVANLSATIPTNLNGYVPKNNKLFTHPFSFLNLTNNVGQTIEFKYEDFSVDATTKKIIAKFNLQASISAGMNIKAIPVNYKNIALNFNYGLTLGKLPLCSWTSDSYLNWQTQNGLNPFINTFQNVATGVANLATGDVSSTISSAQNIYNSLHQIYLAKQEPNQAHGNVNTSDLNFSYKNDGGLTAYYMSIKKEYAKIIDDYFTYFGYKVNEFKAPQFKSRKNWNYIKTVECNILGSIPQEFIEIIKTIFNKGITFWHSATTFLDYTQDNSIV